MLNIYESIVLPLRLDGAEIDREFLEEIMGFLGIQEKVECLPAMLSGGQQQRVAIARSLMMRPEILLCDEPTGSLDSVMSMEVAGLLRRCSEQFRQTVIVVTHQDEVAQMGNRIVRLKYGKICGIKENRKRQTMNQT